MRSEIPEKKPDNTFEEGFWKDSEKYGAKCARLMMLHRDPGFSAVALPVYPLDPAYAHEYVARAGSEGKSVKEHVAGYAAFLKGRHPGLAEQLREMCGDAPWIVRSSGAEDQEDNVNAGGYESLVCRRPQDLYATVAAVVFSGYSEHSIAQQRLADPSHRPSPIAAFVQPLVEMTRRAANPPVAVAESPLLVEDDIVGLVGLLTLLHRRFGMSRVDSEWVLETDAGTVSVTGLTELVTNGRLVGQLTLGFGFASAQRLGDGDNSLAWLTGRPGTTLWRGALLRQVETTRTRLVQVRPAAAFAPEPSLEVLTDACRDRWRDACTAAPVDILVPPRRVVASSFLTSVRLEDAWSRYLRLDPGQRARLGHVLVERGSPAEHAAVMFRQEGVAVLRGRPEDIPETASYVLADPWAQECYFGVGRPPAVETSKRRMSAMPQGCRLLFASAHGTEAATAAGMDGRPLEPALMPGATHMYELPHLPPRVRDRIVLDSFLPAPDMFLRRGTDVSSPAFAARAAEALLAGGLPAARVADLLPDVAQDYVRGLAAARATDAQGVAAVLPRCARAASERLAAAVVGAFDVRLAVALARLETSSMVSDAALESAVSSALVLAGGNGGVRAAAGTEAALGLLAAVEALAAAMRVLDVYSAQERDDVITRMVAALPVEDAAHTEALCRFAARSSASPAEIYRLLDLAARDEEFAALYLAVERGRVDLSGADAGDAVRRSRALNDAYRAYESAAAWLGGGDAVLLDLTRSDLIEAYDSTLKRLLLELVDRPEPGPYRAYLDVLAQWLDLVREFRLSPREERAVAGFGVWIAGWREAAVPGAFVLDEDQTWDRLLDMAAEGVTVDDEEGPGNPHQLHNALHQWLLARTARYPAERAPAGVRELQRLSDRFGPGGNKLLRFTRDAIELDVPLGIHKASLMFRPDRVEGEWTEPPDVTEEEAGRLTGLAVLLDRCGTWFPEMVFRWERVLLAGTWTLRVEARPPTGTEQFTFAQMSLALGVFRTLFDGSYDFSYVPVQDVADLEGAFREPEWAEAFRALVAYRLVYEDAELFETLETLPLGTAIGTLCTDARIRAEVLSASAGGPESALERLDRAWRRLASTADPTEWITGYNAVQQLALLVAAQFPEAAVATVVAADPPGWADVLAAAVLPRADVREDVVRAFVSMTGREGLLLRRAPWLVVSEANAADVARRVAVEPRSYRRCKQFLVHRYADVLEDAGLLDGLVAELEVVPYGHDPRQEVPLSAAVVAAGGRLRRDIRTKPGIGAPAV
ncbi:hypothetical protein GCM10019016_010510 [Streptomyces prasinosporus]|uniref:Uncharacterized protein n=1 Tax=Streptomyces prasinosporus TaxID=68256 RepID=A0ABP6TG64_9ACTN|nr:hypothetical protein GCM10010332_72090 [Streptomyces albogriseolus]